jgi:hypothetical protein
MRNILSGARAQEAAAKEQGAAPTAPPRRQGQ